MLPKSLETIPDNLERIGRKSVEDNLDNQSIKNKIKELKKIPAIKTKWEQFEQTINDKLNETNNELTLKKDFYSSALKYINERLSDTDSGDSFKELDDTIKEIFNNEEETLKLFEIIDDIIKLTKDQKSLINDLLNTLNK